MKIVLAMSGGVDSACAGLLLRRMGHEVLGVTMLVDGFPPPPAMDSGVKECCSKLGIEHRYIDVSETFRREVIQVAAEACIAGLTPNPCSLCNPAVKFGELLRFTRSVGGGPSRYRALRPSGAPQGQNLSAPGRRPCQGSELLSGSAPGRNG